MKIIDAQLSLDVGNPYLDELALESDQENSVEYLLKKYREQQISLGIVVDMNENKYPKFLRYCIGVTSLDWKTNFSQIQKHIHQSNCVGIKLFPGYFDFFVDDSALEPIYELARKFNKPIVIHTGFVSNENFDVPIFCQPRTIALAAERFPQNQFVMCHFGQPNFREAAKLMKKFPNLSADLSGILEGKMSIKNFDRSFIDILRNSIELIGDFERLMFGTDFPLANIENCIEFSKAVIPEHAWENFFYFNAKRIYHLER